MSNRERGDYTSQAIVRQLKAMSCERYDIGILDAVAGKMLQREWAPQEVQRNVNWLKRRNTQGCEIYIRPAQEEIHGLVLVDDLSVDDIETMKQDGREPALVVETSPKNFQAWVKVSKASPEALRGEIARQLAHEYDADQGSADSRHYGRLAGFTNRKSKHCNRVGHQPYVLCRESSGRVATAGPELMQHAGKRLQERELQQEHARQADEFTQAVPMPLYHRRDAVDEYASEMRGLVKRFTDLSRCDFIAAKTLALRGRCADEIAGAMEQASPGLGERKLGHEADYIRRTVAKVMKLPQVQAAHGRLAQRSQGRN